jgi:TonB family protein
MALMMGISKNNPSPNSPASIIRICFVLSFLLHLSIFFALQHFSPLQWAGETLKSYRIDLLRPPVDDIYTEGPTEKDITQIQHEPPKTPEADQETISLDTSDERYVTFAKVIKDRIMTRWRYPQEARRNLLEGKLTIIFSLARDGTMLQAKIPMPSGYEVLDEEALRAIRSAAPFPPFPEHISVNRLNIKATFDYRLKAKK